MHRDPQIALNRYPKPQNSPTLGTDTPLKTPDTSIKPQNRLVRSPKDSGGAQWQKKIK